jgi:GTP-binding protein
VTALNKIDALSPEEIAEKTTILEGLAGDVMQMSGVSRDGVVEVLRRLRANIDAGRLRMMAVKEEPGPWQP